MSTTAIDVNTELQLAHVRKHNLRKTFEQIKLQSSSILFLAIQWNELESHFDSLHDAITQRHERLVSVDESLRKRLEEVKSREERVESLQESVNSKLKEIELNEANEKLLFVERMKELDSIGAALEARSKEIEGSRVCIEEGMKALDSKKKDFHLFEEMSDRRTKDLEDLQTSVKESIRELEIREEHLSLSEQRNQERIGDIELREARMEERLKTFKSEENRLAEQSVKFALLDRKLKECAAEVTATLRESPHPGKPVLLDDCSSVIPLMQFPRQEGSDTGQATKQEKVPDLRLIDQKCYKRTFEQMMAVPAEMRHHSKEAALNFALILKAKINGEMTTQMEVFRFLQLVANYDVASSFDADELICHFKKVKHFKQAPDLFRGLGLVNEIPRFVKNLIEEDCCLEAVRYIIAFELNHKSPLRPVLGTYMKEMDEKTCMLAHQYPDDQNHSANREVSASIIVLEHIENHKLELECPPKIPEDHIKPPVNHKMGYTLPSIIVQQNIENSISTSKADTSSVHLQTMLQEQAQPQHQSGIKRSGRTQSSDRLQRDPHTTQSNEKPKARPEHRSGIKRCGTNQSTYCLPSDNTTTHSNQKPKVQARPQHRSGIKGSDAAESTDTIPSDATTTHSDQKSKAQAQRQAQAQAQRQAKVQTLAQPLRRSGIKGYETAESTAWLPSGATTTHSNQKSKAQTQTQAHKLHQIGTKRPRTIESTECPPSDATTHLKQRPPKRKSRFDDTWGEPQDLREIIGRHPTRSRYRDNRALEAGIHTNRTTSHGQNNLIRVYGQPAQVYPSFPLIPYMMYPN